jgi:DNA-binding NarL/FixJ family response regulator
VPDIRLVVINDLSILREGIRAVAASTSDLHVIAATAGIAEAIARDDPADVVVMDLPDSAAIDGIRMLRRTRASRAIVVFTERCDEERVYAAVHAGARGYIGRDALPSELITAVRTVHAGCRYLSAEASTCLAEHVAGQSVTRRERQVLALLARGGRNKAIARSLGIAEETVKWHVKNILVKLGVAGRGEAACRAAERGLV